MGQWVKWVAFSGGSGAKNKMGQDGSKFTGQSLASYKKEAQEHGASILNPLQWVSKNRKTLPKLKNGHYSAFNARHILTPLRNQKSTFAKCCWSYFCKFGKLQKYLLQSLSFLVTHFWIKLWVMSQSPDGSSGSWVEHKRPTKISAWCNPIIRIKLKICYPDLKTVNPDRRIDRSLRLKTCKLCQEI